MNYILSKFKNIWGRAKDIDETSETENFKMFFNGVIMNILCFHCVIRPFEMFATLSWIIFSICSVLIVFLIINLCWDTNPCSRYLYRFFSSKIWSKDFRAYYSYQLITWLLGYIFYIITLNWIAIPLFLLAIYLGIVPFVRVIQGNLKK